MNHSVLSGIEDTWLGYWVTELQAHRVTGSQSYRVTELQCYRVKALGQLVHGRTCFSYHQHMIATTRGAVIVNVSVLQSLINQAQPASSMLPPTHDMPPMATTRDLLAESTHSRTDRKTRGRGRLHKSFFLQVFIKYWWQWEGWPPKSPASAGTRLKTSRWPFR